MVIGPLSSVLSPDEIEIVRGSLRAMVSGGFIPEWEFQTVVGVNRETVRAVLEAWPRQTLAQDEFADALIGSLNNLVGYPHGMDDELRRYVPEGRVAIMAVLDDLRILGF